MNAHVYRLPDEPLPSGLAKYVVAPMWPLFAVMLGGSIYGLAWFLFNGAALGAQSRARDWALAALAVVGSLVLLLAMAYAKAQGWLPGAGVAYAMLSVIVLKMACAYALFVRQSATFEIWEHYGGTPANGAIVLVPLAVFGGKLLNAAPLPALLLTALR